jgi:hypothetical protein
MKHGNVKAVHQAVVAVTAVAVAAAAVTAIDESNRLADPETKSSRQQSHTAGCKSFFEPTFPMESWLFSCAC